MLKFSENFKNPVYFQNTLWHVKFIQKWQDLALPLQFYSTDLAFIFAVSWILRDADKFFLFFN